MKLFVLRTKATRWRKNYTVRFPFGGAQEWIFGYKNIKYEAATNHKHSKNEYETSLLSIFIPVIVPKMRNFEDKPDNSNVIGMYFQIIK
jgi:hypothetical protein